MSTREDDVLSVPRGLFDQLVTQLEIMLDPSAFARRRDLFDRAKALALAGRVISHHLDADTDVPLPEPIRAED